MKPAPGSSSELAVQVGDRPFSSQLSSGWLGLRWETQGTFPAPGLWDGQLIHNTRKSALKTSLPSPLPVLPVVDWPSFNELAARH